MDILEEITQRIGDVQSLVERGNDAYENGHDATHYLISAIAELGEIVKAQQEIIKSLKD